MKIVIARLPARVRSSAQTCPGLTRRQWSPIAHAVHVMQYTWDFAILGKYSHLFWVGLGWTVAYTIGTVLLGTLIGLIVGILRCRVGRS